MEHLFPKDQNWFSTYFVDIVLEYWQTLKRSELNIPMYLHMHAVVRVYEFSKMISCSICFKHSLQQISFQISVLQIL